MNWPITLSATRLQLLTYRNISFSFDYTAQISLHSGGCTYQILAMSVSFCKFVWHNTDLTFLVIRCSATIFRRPAFELPPTALVHPGLHSPVRYAFTRGVISGVLKPVSNHFLLVVWKKKPRSPNIVVFTNHLLCQITLKENQFLYHPYPIFSFILP